MTDLATALLDASDFVEARGVPLPFKRRDPQEPGRREKELGELRLQRAMMRLFRAQADQIREWLEKEYPARKQVGIPPWEFLAGQLDAEWLAIYLILSGATQGGIDLFAAAQAIGLDYTLVNAQAMEFARTYVYDQFRQQLDETTIRALQEAVSAFVETPGMSIGDVMAQLPFDLVRARRVARTEITRAYAEGNLMGGRALQEEFPDLQVIKLWYTAVDDRVCEICGPLHKAVVGIGEAFKGGMGVEIDAPPAHVNCRCAVETMTELALEGMEEINDRRGATD